MSQQYYVSWEEWGSPSPRPSTSSLRLRLRNNMQHIKTKTACHFLSLATCEFLFSISSHLTFKIKNRELHCFKAFTVIRVVQLTSRESLSSSRPLIQIVYPTVHICEFLILHFTVLLSLWYFHVLLKLLYFQKSYWFG